MTWVQMRHTSIRGLKHVRENIHFARTMNRIYAQ